MGLLKQFEGMQLPAASELEWLVPEHDAPQKVGVWVSGHRLHLIVLPRTPGFSPLPRGFASPGHPFVQLQEKFGLGDGCNQEGLCHWSLLQQSAWIPGDIPSPAPIQLEQQLGAWQFSRGLHLQVSGKPARCIAFVVPGRYLTLLPASPSSCPSPTLCPSLPTTENMLTSTS